MDRGLLVVPQSIRRRRMPQSNHHFFFFNDTATTEIYTLSLHDALPISGVPGRTGRCVGVQKPAIHVGGDAEWTSGLRYGGVSAGASAARRGGKGKKTSSAGSTDRKSTRLNSSHLVISYAVFCLKKKNRT